MARKITVGIDVGTYQVKVVVVEHVSRKGRAVPNIIGTGFVQSKGIRHGYIINGAEATRSVREAIRQASEAAKLPIRRAYLSVGGVGLDEIRAKGQAVVSRADLEISDLDVQRALEDSEEQVSQKLLNRRILHAVPVEYRIESERVFGRPQGMKGSKLEVETLFVTSLEQHLNDLISAVEEAGVAVIDVMAAPIAASFVTLTKAQKTAGCVLANIGAETVSIVVFENNTPISVKVFPIGSTDITNDIALGLKVSLEEAEAIKTGKFSSSSYPKKKLDEIVSARLSDIFDLIEAHLKDIDRNGLLPAGIIITGGGSGIATIEDIARAALKLPSKKVSFAKKVSSKIKDSSWAIAYGLAIWGLSAGDETAGISLAKKTGGSLASFVKQFLP